MKVLLAILALKESLVLKAKRVNLAHKERRVVLGCPEETAQMDKRVKSGG